MKLKQTWTEFAKKIGGQFEEPSSGFLGGDVTIKTITKESEGEQLNIQKTVRKSYGASSHSNVEKLSVKYILENSDFGNTRISRKSLIQRIGKTSEHQYEIEGEHSDFLQKILPLNELKHLLQHPKSELIFLQNAITFKSQSLGEMNEDLEQIFHAIKILKDSGTKSII